MPIYDFYCVECDVTYERLTRMGEKSITCENCGRKIPMMLSVGGVGWRRGVRWYSNFLKAGDNAQRHKPGTDYTGVM